MANPRSPPRSGLKVDQKDVEVDVELVDGGDYMVDGGLDHTSHSTVSGLFNRFSSNLGSGRSGVSRQQSFKETKRTVSAFIILLVTVVIALLTYFIPSSDPILASDNEAVALFDQEENNGELHKGDIGFMMTSSAFVLLMTPGLAFFYAGMVKPKNVISTLLLTYASMGIITITWIFVGFSLAFGDSVYGLFGNPATYFVYHNVGAAPNADFSANIPLELYSIFQVSEVKIR